MSTIFKAVFDASVIIALVKRESNTQLELIENLLDDAVISTINLAEVIRYLYLSGIEVLEVKKILQNCNVNIVNFTLADMYSTSVITSKKGLSFGDRVCLALGSELNLPIYTANKTWLELNLGLRIKLVRN